MFEAGTLLGSGTAIATFAAMALAVLQGGSEAPANAVPAPQRETPSSAASGRVEVPRADDGLFYLVGQVNGVAVRFLVDTGATVVVLTRADAQRARVALDDPTFGDRVGTANGSSPMTWAKLRTVRFGSREITQVRAAIPRDGLPVSLLGQDLLSRIGPLTIDGDRMHVQGGDWQNGSTVGGDGQNGSGPI